MPKRTYATKRERFVNVAEARTQAILDKIRILGHCSNKSLYEYEPEEIDKIFRTIQNQLSETKTRFSQKRIKEFKL
ncbi:MAG: hypothetical protein HYT08_00705 [Candidatus Levybacteria bacterium]|nr:hypothetical protein [Candidatus Levybacteria bacterium]